MRGGALIELIDRDDATAMDGELVHMAHRQTVTRLAIGEAFVALGSGWQELGFSRFTDFVQERCVRSGRWGEETRTLAARLAALPRTRAALVGHAIRWSMAELLARHARPDDEEELLEATRGMTVRQVREALRERGEGEDREEEARDGMRERGEGEDRDEDVRYGTLDLRTDAIGAWMLTATIPMIELLDGRGEPGAWFESLLAEAQCALSNMACVVDLVPEDVVERQEAFVASIRAGIERVARREARAEGSLPPMPPVEAAVIEPPPSGALAIDRVIRCELAPRLASCDLRFGELLGRFFRARGWKVLGFASETQYCRERLGTSRASVYARITLAKRAAHLEQMGDAVREGRLGQEAAVLIGRVATPDTEAAWIERASARTFKHLREEVSAVELVRRMMRCGDPPGPPSDDEIEIVQALGRDMKCGAYARRAFGIEREDDRPEALEAAMVGRESAYAAMAGTALAAQRAIRAIIDRAHARVGSVTPEEAEAACTGVTAPTGEPPTRDLEDDVVWCPGAPSAEQLVQMSAVNDARAGAPSAEPLVQMSAVNDARAGAPSAEQLVQMSVVNDARGGAPSAEQLVQMSAASRAKVAEPVQRSALLPDSPSPRLPVHPTPAAAEEDEAVQMSAERWASVLLRVRAREDLILHYRMLEAVFERSGLGGRFEHFMVLVFWATWAPMLGRTNACEEILRRDGYECTCPVCTRASAPGSHHVKFRSHGGGEEKTNKTSPCDWCHLDGIHGGRLRAKGAAPDLVWLIGRTPIMEVRGRERRLVA